MGHHTGSELIIYLLEKRLLGLDPYPLMSHGAHGQPDAEVRFMGGDPGKESTRHRAGGRLAQNYNLAPDSQPRPMLLAAEELWGVPRHFPGLGCI